MSTVEPFSSNMYIRAAAFFTQVADAVCKASSQAQRHWVNPVEVERHGDAVFIKPSGELYVPGPLTGYPPVSIEAVYVVPPGGQPHTQMLTVRLRGKLVGEAWADFSEYGLELADMPNIIGHCQRLWAAFDAATRSVAKRPLRTKKRTPTAKRKKP